MSKENGQSSRGRFPLKALWPNMKTVQPAGHQADMGWDPIGPLS